MRVPFADKARSCLIGLLAVLLAAGLAILGCYTIDKA
jgi:hypothetical protein